MPSVQSFLGCIDEAIQENPDSLVVRVHRYSKPEDRYGYHILIPVPDAHVYPFRHQTLGLISSEGDRELRLALDIKRGLDVLTYLNHRLVIADTPRTLWYYLIHQVSPIEWHSKLMANDEDLVGRITVMATATSHRNGKWREPVIA